MKEKTKHVRIRYSTFKELKQKIRPYEDETFAEYFDRVEKEVKR